MFEALSYTTTENNGTVLVCVLTNEGALLERPVTFSIRTVEESASEISDYVPTQANLAFSSPPFRECVNISVGMDEVVEDSEIFLVILESNDSAVDIQIPSTTVSIVDSSQVEVGFVGGLFEVSEGGNESVCVMTLDSIDRNISITLNVNGSEGMYVGLSL